MYPCFNLGLRFAMSFNYLSPKACEASDGGRRHERRRRLFSKELILQGKARSDDADKLGADFTAAPPDRLVRAFPGQHRPWTGAARIHRERRNLNRFLTALEHEPLGLNQLEQMPSVGSNVLGMRYTRA